MERDHYDEILHDTEDIHSIARYVRKILKVLGEDANREGLQKTPLRVAKALKFLTSGLVPEEEIKKLVTSAEFSTDYREMVVVRDIEFSSLCEHHILPFYGKAHVAYVPNDKVIGLSKIPRVVEIFSRRLQIQEQLTVEIRDALQKHLKPKGVAVVIEAHHMCMAIRGVQKPKTSVVTSSLSGSFLKEDKTRKEFMNLIGLSK
jgi:GTP cyclohydrolase I